MTSLQESLDQKFRGVLTAGSHPQKGDDQACSLELLAAARGIHLLPLDWPLKRQQEVVSRIVIGTVREIIAELPGLPDDVRERCRGADTLKTAAAAARRAVTAAGAWAAPAALSLAAMALAAAEAEAGRPVEAAWWATVVIARAAQASPGPEDICAAACRVWLEAAQ